MTYYYVYPFGQSADDLTAIPTQIAGDGSVSYFQGWTDPYEYNLLSNPAALPIPRGQMNQLFLDITLNIQEYQQYGTPQFVLSSQNLGSPLPYPIYARVYYSGQVYENQVAGNTVTPGTDNSWLLISGSSNGTRTGTIIDYAGITAPFGYLACDGSAISRTTYAPLLTALTQTQSVTTTVSATITGLTNCQTTMYPGMHVESPNLPSGTTIVSVNSATSITVSNTASAGATTIKFFNWGNGDGSTTFNVPNLLYRGTMGSGGTPGTTAQAPSTGLPTGVVGSVGGESQHTQLSTELVSHNHTAHVGSSADTNTGINVKNSQTNNVSVTVTVDSTGGGQP